MIEGVADNGVLWTEDSLEESSVGIEAAGEKNGILEMVVRRYSFL
jgi:hypothetical protein